MAMFLTGVPQLGFAPTLPVISPMTTRPAAVMSAADKLCAADHPAGRRDVCG